MTDVTENPLARGVTVIETRWAAGEDDDESGRSFSGDRTDVWLGDAGRVGLDLDLSIFTGS